MVHILCEEEHQLEAVYLHVIWFSKLGWMPSAMHLSFYLTRTHVGDWEERKLWMYVTLSFPAQTNPGHASCLPHSLSHSYTVEVMGAMSLAKRWTDSWIRCTSPRYCCLPPAFGLAVIHLWLLSVHDSLK